MVNPYELADWLDKTIHSRDWGELAKYYDWCQKHISPMLRQQEAEIQNLTKTLDSALEELIRLKNERL